MKPIKLSGKCLGHGARNMSPIKLELYLQPLRTPPAGHSKVCRALLPHRNKVLSWTHTNM